MMKTRTQTLALALFMVSMLAACAKNGGFEGSTDAASSNGTTNNGQNANGNVPAGRDDTALKALDTKGFVDGGTFDKSQTFELDKTSGEMVITLPLGTDATVMIGSGSIPKLPGVSFYTTYNAMTGGYSFVIRVPVKYFLRDVASLPADRLPNGDPLPMIPGGELPSTAFAINAGARKVYLYLGLDSVALFVESPWISCGDLPVCINFTVPIRNTAKTQVVGFFSLVMPKSGTTGGFFLSAMMPPKMAAILEEYFLN